MQSGKLDQQIFFESLVENYDRGEVSQSFQPVDMSDDSPSVPLATWAYVQTSRGQEAFNAAHTQARKTIRVQVRYRADVTENWRFKWNNVYYYITDLDDVFRRKGELWMTAQVKDGPQ